MIVNPPQNNPYITLNMNLIQNPGFESGQITPWTNGDGSLPFINGQVTNSNPHTGTYCLDIYPSGGRSALQALPNVPAAKIVNCTIYYKQGPGGNQSYIIIKFSDGTDSGNTYGLSDNSGTWVQTFDFGGSINGYAPKLVSGFYLQGGNVTHFYVDDVVLTGPLPRNTTLLTYPPQS
jgi:hypothetical protein